MDSQPSSIPVFFVFLNNICPLYVVQLFYWKALPEMYSTIK